MSVKGRPLTAEHRAALSIARRNRAPHSPETRAKMSAAHSGVPKSAAHREAIRQAQLNASDDVKKRRIDALRKAIAETPEAARKAMGRKVSATMISRGTCRGRNNPHFGKTPKHGPRTHWTEYAGVKMRSSYEVRFAKWLDSRGFKWEYEPKRFDLGECTYLPDFRVAALGGYVELKGWLDPSSQQRIQLFRKRHPELPLIVIDERVLRQFESLTQ